MRACKVCLWHGKRSRLGCTGDTGMKNIPRDVSGTDGRVRVAMFNRHYFTRRDVDMQKRHLRKKCPQSAASFGLVRTLVMKLLLVMVLIASEPEMT